MAASNVWTDVETEALVNLWSEENIQDALENYSVCNIREFTHVRRQHQDDGYQYNIINPIAQKKLIIKSISRVSDVVHALLTTARCIFSRLVKYASISSCGRRFF